METSTLHGTPSSHSSLLEKSRRLGRALGTARHLAKRCFKWGIIAGCGLLGSYASRAADHYASGYSAQAVYTSSGGIGGFNWGGDEQLYFADWDGNLFRAGEEARQDVLLTSHSGWTGVSMFAHGDFLYYNWSTSEEYFIQRYNVVTGENDAVSDAANYSFAIHNSTLFIAGAENFGPNNISFTPLAADGSVVFDSPSFLIETGGAPGPIGFNANGDLYYGMGYGGQNLYSWSAAQLAAAMDDPIGSPLTLETSLSLDLSEIFDNEFAGLTAMAIDENGDIYLTLTTFMSGSQLVRITPDGVGEVVMVSDERLGEIRFWDGNLYIASGDTLYMVIPEPSTVMLLSALGAALLFTRGWKGRRGAV